MTTLGESYHQHVVRHSHVGGDTTHDHMQEAIAACGPEDVVKAPEAFWRGLARVAFPCWESLAPAAPAGCGGRFEAGDEVVRLLPSGRLVHGGCAKEASMERVRAWERWREENRDG